MAGPINVDALAEEVMKGLEEYASLAADEMKKAVRKSSSTVRKGIEERAPIRSGKYRKSWKAIKTKENASILEMTVYSPTRYMLAHLLENGHRSVLESTGKAGRQLRRRKTLPHWK